MKVRATTAGRHIFGPDLFVQGRLEVQWQPGGLFHKISVDNYTLENWTLTLLVWAAAKEYFDFEHVDVDEQQLSSVQEEPSGSNAPTRD